jgi:hypothetical protein
MFLDNTAATLITALCPCCSNPPTLEVAAIFDALNAGSKDLRPLR